FGFTIPDGFVVTIAGYDRFLSTNNLVDKVNDIYSNLDISNPEHVAYMKVFHDIYVTICENIYKCRNVLNMTTFTLPKENNSAYRCANVKYPFQEGDTGPLTYYTVNVKNTRRIQRTCVFEANRDGNYVQCKHEDVEQRSLVPVIQLQHVHIGKQYIVNGVTKNDIPDNEDRYAGNDRFDSKNHRIVIDIFREVEKRYRHSKTAERDEKIEVGLRFWKKQCKNYEAFHKVNQKEKEKIMKQKTPTWQTSVNMAAMTLTAAGVSMLVTQNLYGLVLFVVAAGLEWFKYSQRFK
ncbi:hypothetical protein IIB79_09305, partial [candidate division KSB1 bacterium]|nr:hypothetical protein [candidate division KSB1 bacterium]